MFDANGEQQRHGISISLDRRCAKLLKVGNRSSLLQFNNVMLTPKSTRVYAPFLLQNRIFNYKRAMQCSKFKGLRFTIGSGIQAQTNSLCYKDVQVEFYYWVWYTLCEKPKSSLMWTLESFSFKKLSDFRFFYMVQCGSKPHLPGLGIQNGVF